MSGEQFDEKDRNFINDAINDVNFPYGEKVVIKRFLGISNPGDPASGIQPVFSFRLISYRAVVDSVPASDVLYSGGIYQIGDLRITLTQKLNFIDTVSQTGGTTVGDRVIYREHEYRIVGRLDPETLIDRDKVFIYVLRKIGNK